MGLQNILATCGAIEADTASFGVDLSPVLSAIAEVSLKVFNLTHGEEGEPVQRIIPVPSQPDFCMLFETCLSVSTRKPPSSVTAYLQFIQLPYAYKGTFILDEEIPAQYEASTGVISWEVIYGAVVKVTIKELGIQVTVKIPAQEKIKLSNLLHSHSRII